MALKTPILFIIFNRPETTVQVFEAIRKAQPRQLFVAADGPREGKVGEKERCEVARRIATNVDWDCEVKTLFRDANIGCGRGPAEAITWFFTQVKKGIILEDDCLPAPSFFSFCNELLKRYEYNENVVIISGFNPLGTFDAGESDYFFTKHGGIWGWATWRRAWNYFKYNAPEWKNECVRTKVLDALSSDADRHNMTQHLDGVVYGKRIDFWDFQWWFYRLTQNGLGIVPKYNLIKNIGFGVNATHTFDITNPATKIDVKNLIFPLKHPLNIIEDPKYVDRIADSHKCNTRGYSSIMKKLHAIFKKVKNTMQNFC